MKPNRTMAITDAHSVDARYLTYREKAIFRRDKEVFKRIMHSAAGRWFVMRILEMSRYKAQSFTGNSQTFYNEGLRAIGIQLDQRIMDLLGVDGFTLKQKAEKEYIKFQEGIKQRFYDEED